MRQPEHGSILPLPRTSFGDDHFCNFSSDLLQNKIFQFKVESKVKIQCCSSWNFLCAFKLFVKRWVVCFANYHYCAKGRAGFARQKIVQQIAFSEKKGPQRAGRYMALLHIYIRSRKSNAFLRNLIKKRNGQQKTVMCVSSFLKYIHFPKIY